MLKVLHWKRKEYRITLTSTCVGLMEQLTLHNVHGLLSVTFICTNTMQSSTFSTVGPVVRIGLPLEVHLLPRLLSETFYKRLKTVLLDRA